MGGMLTSAREFRTLIQINDLQNPLVETLSRAIRCGKACSTGRRRHPLPAKDWKLHHRSNAMPTICCASSILAPPSSTIGSPWVEQHWVRFDILPGEQHAGGSDHHHRGTGKPAALFPAFRLHHQLRGNPNSEGAPISTTSVGLSSPTSIACRSSTWPPPARRNKERRKHGQAGSELRRLHFLPDQAPRISRPSASLHAGRHWHRW